MSATFGHVGNPRCFVCLSVEFKIPLSRAPAKVMLLARGATLRRLILPLSVPARGVGSFSACCGAPAAVAGWPLQKPATGGGHRRGAFRTLRGTAALRIGSAAGTAFVERWMAMPGSVQSMMITASDSKALQDQLGCTDRELMMMLLGPVGIPHAQPPPGPPGPLKRPGHFHRRR